MRIIPAKSGDWRGDVKWWKNEMFARNVWRWDFWESAVLNSWTRKQVTGYQKETISRGSVVNRDLMDCYSASHSLLCRSPHVLGLFSWWMFRLSSSMVTLADTGTLKSNLEDSLNLGICTESRNPNIFSFILKICLLFGWRKQCAFSPIGQPFATVSPAFFCVLTTLLRVSYKVWLSRSNR